MLWEFYEHLQKLDIDRHRLFSLFHSKISTFIDPETVDESFQKLVFLQSTDLLLVESPPDAIPRFAFDLYSTKLPPLSEEKKLLFDSLGIQYQAIKIDQFDLVTADLLGEVMANTPDVDKLRGVMNDWQWNAMKVLEKIARSKGLFLLQEVALDSVIAVQGEHRRSQGGGAGEERPRSAIPWQDKEFLRKTSFDGLICTQPPNCSPIIAIEYDGAHHLTDKQRKKDSKKDRACEAANLPLVRIRSRDLPSPNTENPGRSLDELRRLEVQGILRILVEELSDRQLGSSWYLEQVHHFLTSTASSIRSKLPDVAEDILGYSEDMLVQAKRGNENLLLAKAEAEDKGRELLRLEESTASLRSDDYERRYEEALYRGEHLDELADMLEQDFESALWKSHHGLTVIEKSLSKDQEKTPYHLEIRSSEVLELGGFKYRRRFDGAKTDVTVVADRFDIAQTLKDKGSVQSLKERATESLATDKGKIIEAFREGRRLDEFRKRAKGWENRRQSNRDQYPNLSDQLEAKIDDHFARASRKQTPDIRVPLEKLDDHVAALEKLIGPERAEEHRKYYVEKPDEYTQQQIFNHLKSMFQEVKEVINFVDVDDALRERLLAYTTKKMNAALEDLHLSANG